MLRFLIVPLVALALSSSGDAAGRRRVAHLAPARMTVTPTMPASVYAPIAAVSAPASVSIPAVATNATTATAIEALDEVNSQRAARGLKPYVRDDNLTAGAMAAAKARADRLLFGHTASDHAYLPAKTFERFRLTNIAAGCAAYPPSYGFLACAVYDDYTYGGAAYVIGRDGRKFCHLFVADGPASLKHGAMFGR